MRIPTRSNGADGPNRRCPWAHSCASPSLRDGAQALRDLPNAVAVRSQLRRVRGPQILQIRHESVHFTHHLRNPPWPIPTDAWNPFQLAADLRIHLIPPVLALLDETFLLQFCQERIDRSGRRPPPTLGHLLDRIHDFRPVLGRAGDQGQGPHPKTPPSGHLPSQGPQGYRQSDIGIPIFEPVEGLPILPARLGGLRSRRNTPEQLNPDSIGVADERERVSGFPKRRDLRPGSLRGELMERTVHVGHAKCEVVKFLSPPIRCVEPAARRIPVQFEPLGRSRALQFDPDPAVAHRPPAGDPHAHHLSVESDRRFDIANSDSRVQEFHHARVTEPSVFTLAARAATGSAHHPRRRWPAARIPRQPPFVSSPRIRGWVWSKSSRVIWSGGTAAYHSDVPVSRRSIRTPPLRCVTRITRSALSYSCRRIDRRRFSFARPAFVTNPTTSRSPIVWRAARIDRWNSWWASRSSTSSSRNIVGRQARTTNPACVSSIFLSSISNINVVIWWHVNARATCTRGRTSSRVSPARFPRATIPCGSTEFPPSRKTTSWPSITARTQSRVVRWNTKSEPLSIRVTLPASKDPRIRSRVGTEVVRAGREIARSSGTGTRAGSTTRAMESSPRFDGDGGIKSEAGGRGERKCLSKVYADGGGGGGGGGGGAGRGRGGLFLLMLGAGETG